MRLQVTPNGLDIEATLALNESPKARDLFAAIKREDIDKMSFMFSIDKERWEDLESEHPTRYIEKIGSVVEVSAVTFPAYDSTSISARSKETLDSAREALENAKQQRSNPLESGAELELAKAKFNFISSQGGRK